MASRVCGTGRGSKLTHKMIGVIADPSEQDVVREFFELFKTPWEFYRSHRRYDVLLSAGDDLVEATAKLVLIYAGRKTHSDNDQRICEACRSGEFCVVSYKGNKLPIYGDTVIFPGRASEILTQDVSNECVAYLEHSETRVLGRIGYDLFNEIRRLVTLGQPPVNANIPALELHIELLRNLIISCGIRLLEVPPIPDGYPFMVCLTHDVDHPSIRQHRWDHTMLGFVYRAIVGSMARLLRGHIGFRTLLANWMAVLKLPFVQMGLAKDFWHEFADRYLELEKGLCSTFFFIPFKNRQGRNSRGLAPKYRAASYEARDLADTIEKLNSPACEVGLHGIDAWVDRASGHKELQEIRRLTGASAIGVRMHWLYYDQQAPMNLEHAGAAYDSTIGYNETVGYRAGTLQVYKPLQASRLLELPLHIMDTALFYAAYLGLSRQEAATLLGRLAEHAVQFGGCLTINWHDRSLAPERQWESSYRYLIEELKSRGAWFSTAGQAVSWFRKRRSVLFETDCTEPDIVRIRLSSGCGDRLPGLRVRVHNAQPSKQAVDQEPRNHFDMPLDESAAIRLPLAAVC
jgi:hypothetical protein